MKLSYKNTFIWFASFLISFSLFGQETDKPAREIGITTGSLSSYSLVYKYQYKNKDYIRFDVASARLGISDNIDNINIGGSIRVTKEKRNEISNKAFLNYGPGLGLAANAAFNRVDDRTNISLAPTFHYLLGIQYKMTQNIYIGAEITPSIGLGLSYNNSQDELSYNLNLNATNIARLSAMYQF